MEPGQFLKNILCTSCLRQAIFRTRKQIGPHHVPKQRFIHTHVALNFCNNGEPQGEAPEPPQAYSLSGYYSEIISTPSCTSPSSIQSYYSTPSAPPPPTPPPQEEKLSIVFGTRLAGPGYSSARYNSATVPPDSIWRTINGVPIPPRPLEPDNCCMSGCVNCVWDDYRDNVEAWAARVQEAQKLQPRRADKSRRKTKNAGNRLGSDNDICQRTRGEMESPRLSMHDDSGASETNWGSISVAEDDLFDGIPVGIREFMKTEKRLKEKRRKEEGLV